jgi:hypothetical protein
MNSPVRNQAVWECHAVAHSAEWSSAGQLSMERRSEEAQTDGQPSAKRDSGERQRGRRTVLCREVVVRCDLWHY